jgi:hypothetical protein
MYYTWMDFAKAFNKVPHERLLKKMAANGLIGEMESWVTSWRKEKQYRIPGGEKSFHEGKKGNGR